MKIICDSCGYGFELANQILIEHQCPDGLIEVYYSCLKCKKKFHVCWHNAETKRLQKLIKRNENKGNLDRAGEYKTKLKAAVDTLNNRL